MRKVSKKQEAEFVDAYNKSWQFLFNRARLWTRSEQIAEEIVQDVYMKVWKALQTKSIDRLEHYLHRAMTLTLIDYSRKYSKHKVSSLEKLMEDSAKFEPHTQDSEMKIPWMIEEIKKTDLLTSYQKAILIASLETGEKPKQLAHKFGIDANAFSVALCRARQRARPLFQPRVRESKNPPEQEGFASESEQLYEGCNKVSAETLASYHESHNLKIS